MPLLLLLLTSCIDTQLSPDDGKNNQEVIGDCAAEIQVSDASLRFGPLSQSAGEQETQTLIIQNPSGCVLEISDVSVSGTAGRRTRWAASRRRC